MVSPAINPTPAQGPQPGPGAGAQPGSMGGMGSFAKLSMAAEAVAQAFPELAPDMRQLENQVRQWTIKAIQKRSQPPQATPQI